MIEGQEDVSWDDWLALAGACEEHGLEGLFRSDHYLTVMGQAGRGSLDAWAMTTALAAVTKRIRLGTMVSPATFRHPSELARVVTTADHVSGGRVELGLGAGWHEREHRAYGFEFPAQRVRMERFAEQLEIVHRQWTEDEFDFEGAHYRLEGCRALPRPLQTPHPPIIVGGRALPGTVGPAVRFADEYNTVYTTPAEAAERRGWIEAACRAAGRDPASLVYSLMTGVIVGADRAEVLRRAAAAARIHGESDGEQFLAERVDRWVTGTPDEARARIAEFEAAGIERLFLQLHDHRDLAAVELLASLG